MPPKLIALVALSALVAAPIFAVDAPTPNTDRLLQQMSVKLATAKTFHFVASRKIDALLLDGRDVPEEARVSVSVQRPNRLAARSISKDGTRRFIADGRNLTLFDENKNHYATVPMRTTLDGLVAQLDEKYGFTPPLAEFAVSNSYQGIREQAQSITFAGRETVGAGFLGLGGVECYRLALKGKVADADLWIGVGDSLPHKLVATFHRAGHPQVHIVFASWNLGAPVNASDFTFRPPAGAEKIEMWTSARMQAANTKN